MQQIGEQLILIPTKNNSKMWIGAGSRSSVCAYSVLLFAETIFATQQDYPGATVNTICTAGEISKSLLYHYYADKDALRTDCLGVAYVSARLMRGYLYWTGFFTKIIKALH